jgi:hypothetical protein
MKSTTVLVTGVLWILLSYGVIIVSSAPLLSSSSTSSSCIDDADYRFKKVSKRSCKWIGRRKKKKKKKLCKTKNSIRKNCPLTCGECDEDEFIDVQKCGAAVNSSDNSDKKCMDDLWDPTGDSTMHCFAYGGLGDPCHLSNTNDSNDGLDKDPLNCKGDTFYLWDEPDTQGKTYDWAGKAWYVYSRKFETELRQLRTSGIKITSPLLKAGGEGVLGNNLDEFLNACGDACTNKDDPAYIDVIAVNAFCGDFNGPSGCRGGAAFIYNEVTKISRSTTSDNIILPVYITNWSRLGTSNPDDQIDAIDAIDEFFPSSNNDNDGVVKRVYWFGATDYGGASSNNFLANILSDGKTTLGKYWLDKCESL